MDYPCSNKSEVSNVCNALEDHCLQAMKIVHHLANGRFDWLIFGHQSVNPSREAISILFGKYKRFTLVHSVAVANESNLQLTQILMNFKEVGGGGGGGEGECIILIRPSKTFFNQRNHKVFLKFSLSLFILLTSALNLRHQYLTDDKLHAYSYYSC